MYEKLMKQGTPRTFGTADSELQGDQQLQQAVLVVARSDSSKRNEAIRQLASSLPDPRVNRLLLTTIIERVMQLRKTVHYEYDAFDGDKVQDLLRR
ncbi:hypothetical protein [Paraburkholderia phenazinium]|jgi:hypothetical protein|uniref:Uncharacterized protein n=1 Tax=Paraburkholderia phenazinium TaxID=60549 RepID=A0A1N6ECF2_9BURK|nr:hypothetical protein [Paraburkholderia phenazinium]SIN80718.1 hypothetical protein SAMN05444168_0451 [Paraburkholderia phenazinium]